MGKETYIYIADVTNSGNYQLALSDGNGDFFQKPVNLAEVDLLPGRSGTTHISTTQSGSIEVLELEVDKRIILQFDGITLVGRDNPDEIITLTKGKLNINLETLFEEE